MRQKVYSHFHVSFLCPKISKIKVYIKLLLNFLSFSFHNLLTFDCKRASRFPNPGDFEIEPTFMSVLLWVFLILSTRSIIPPYINPNGSLSNPFYHVHYPTFTLILPGVFLICSTIFIIPPLCQSHQDFFKYSLPYSLSHLYVGPTRSFLNTVYHIHYPTFTLVLPGVFQIHSTIFIIPPLRQSYQEFFKYVLPFQLSHLHPSYHQPF